MTKLHGLDRSAAKADDTLPNWDVMILVKKIKGNNKKAIKQGKQDFICLKSCS